MADLRTSWLGLELDSPLVVAASPLSNDLDALNEAVAAGAGAIIMHSLFEEDIVAEQMGAYQFLDALADHDAEASGYIPYMDGLALDATPYLQQLDRLCSQLKVPVIASLNGTTPGGWTDYAGQLEAHGASAVELNLYDVATDVSLSGKALEAQQLKVVASVVAALSVPVTVKLSPFYSSLPAFVHELQEVGVRGVTVFNRFYQPDIDLEALDVSRELQLSSSAELPLRLHALAILFPQVTLELSCTGGVHSGLDAAKAILAGARVIQVASALLQRGAAQIGVIGTELEQWLQEKGYRSAAEAQGVLSTRSTPDPHQWERLNYVKLLHGWQPRFAARRKHDST